MAEDQNLHSIVRSLLGLSSSQQPMETNALIRELARRIVLSAISFNESTGAVEGLDGSSLTDLNADELTSGTVPLARLVDITNAEIAAAAAIAWSKISKTGSSLADLATRSAGDLSSGNLAMARLPTGGGTWAMGGNVTLTGGHVTNGAQLRCRAYNNAVQSINNTTTTTLTFNSETYDVGAMHSTSSDTSRVTVPTAGDGLYLIVGQTMWEANGTGVRRLSLIKNGATALAESDQASASATRLTAQDAVTIVNLVAGDYVEVTVFQESGGALNAGDTNEGIASALMLTKLW